MFEDDSEAFCFSDLFKSPHDDICKIIWGALFIAYEIRRKFFRNAIRETSKQEKELRENSPKRQSILNAANDLRLGGGYSIRAMTEFFERLVYSDSERDPLAYNILLDLYNQRVPSSSDSDEKYINFDTQNDIHRLWEQIRRNGWVLTQEESVHV